MTEGTTQLSITKFPANLIRQAKQTALDQNVSMAEIVRRAVAEYLATQEKKGQAPSAACSCDDADQTA